MNRKILILILLFIFAVIVIGVLYVFGVFKAQQSLLRVESDPEALVYVNGHELGRTPLEKDLPTGEINLKLVPISDQALSPYEVKLGLTAGVKTIVKRKILPQEESSSGVIISFEKEFGNIAPIAVVANPDGANIKIDNIARGVAPLNITSLSEGTHELVVSAMGYGEEKISLQTRFGYKLTAIVTLGRDGSPLVPQLATPAPSPEAGKKMVEILETPIGYLRVRSEASVASEEVAKIDPGDEFELIEEKGEWVKIEFTQGKFGWVNREYVKITP